MSDLCDDCFSSYPTQKFITGVDGADSINQVMYEKMMDEAVSLSSEFITSDNDHIIRSINDVTMPVRILIQTISPLVVHCAVYYQWRNGLDENPNWHLQGQETRNLQ